MVLPQLCTIPFLILLVVRHTSTAVVGDDIYDAYRGYRIFKTTTLNVSQSSALELYGELWDFWKYPVPGSTTHIFIGPDQLKSVRNILRTFDIQYDEILWEPPVPRQPDEEVVHGNISFTTYHSLSYIYDYLDNLAGKFPKLVTVSNIGSSTTGLPVKMLKISDRETRGRRPSVFIVSGIEGREWIAPSVALYTIYQLLENYTNIEILCNTDWYFIPVLNPDGYEYSFGKERFWKKTRSFNGFSECLGVDIGRNFMFQWNTTGGSDDPCSPMFRGHEPFSEVELSGFMKFTRLVTYPLKLVLELRSYGPSISFPWGYTTDLPNDLDILVPPAIDAAAVIEGVRGTKYSVGSTSQIRQISSGSIADWFRGKLDVPYVYTIHLPPGGSGFDPPVEEIQPIVMETFEAIKFFVTTATSLY